MTTENPFTRAASIADQKAEAIHSKPGRKPVKSPETIDAEATLDQPRFEGAMATMVADGKSLALAESQHQAHVRAVAAQIGYQLPGDCADPDLIQRDISTNMRRTAEAMLQVGLGLVCLKEACQHGEFRARLEVLRFEPSVASRYMKVATKLSNVATSQHLLKFIDSQSKLLELIVLDDEQVEELALTGETGELKLDDISGMSVKELRAAVRELRADKQANEKLLTHKNDQIDKLALIKAAPPDEQLVAMREAATRYMNDTRGALIGHFSASIEALDQHFRNFGGDQTGEQGVAFMAGLVGQLQADLNALRDRFGIPDVLPALIPEWVGDPAFENLAAK